MNINIINLYKLPSPCYLIDIDVLIHNLKIMKKNCDILGIKPLLAVKGFPLSLIYNKLSPYLFGGSASSLYEAYICKQLGKEIHIHSTAYKPDEITKVFELCDHVVFNSLSQWNKYRDLIHKKYPKISTGIRINPEYSEVDTEIYNPCLQYSRLGITQNNLLYSDVSGIEGLHFHVMCDQGANTLYNVINVIINKFKENLLRASWINLGGGHQISELNYDVEIIKSPISKLINDFNLQVYIEPCESIVTSSGFLVSTVLDIINNKKQIVILDTSAICHMPDVVEMPYKPEIIFPQISKKGKYIYSLTGISCLPGDIIGDYNFNKPLKIGDRVIFSDMGAYTFAKENYFNGINHPAIVLYEKKHGFKIVKQFNYDDYAKNYC